MKIVYGAVLTGAFSILMASMVLAKDSGYLFISSEKDSVVTVLDGKSYSVIKKIGTAKRPRHLQFNPDRTLIYAACGNGNSIDVIDVGKLEVVDRITGIEDPELFDLSPDGKTMYISLEDDAALGILNLGENAKNRGGKPDLGKTAGAEPSSGSKDDDATAKGAKDNHEENKDIERAQDDDDAPAVPGLSTIETGAEPEGVLASPDGKTVYVSSEVANLVHVVDLRAGKIKANVKVGKRPRRFALTPDGKELWVSNEIGGSLSIIDTTTNKVLDTIEFAPKGFRREDVTPVGVIIGKDGKTAFVPLGRANHVAVVDVPNRKVETYILVGKRAWNATFNRDESLLFVANGLSDDVSIVNVAARKVIKSISAGRVPHSVLIDD
ncbi:MAG: beta-propeller fold lactonase family protein [Gammaproteobacteria bacterium]